MRFTLAGWSESQDTSNALTRVAALADSVVRATGDNIIVPRGFNRLCAAYAQATTITQARLVAPSIDSGRFFRIAPLNAGTEPAVPTPFLNRFANPIELTETETLNAEVAENGAGAEQAVVLAWFGEAATPEAVPGEIFTVRATGTATLVAQAWSAATLTLQDNLLAGRYAVVGARFEAAGCIAGRFAPVDVGNYRPGCIGYDSVNDADIPVFRNGGLGTWFEFEHDTLPVAEFLSASADTAEVVYLDLVQVRGGAS